MATILLTDEEYTFIKQVTHPCLVGEGAAGVRAARADRLVLGQRIQARPVQRRKEGVLMARHRSRRAYNRQHRPGQGRQVALCMCCEACGRPLKEQPYFNALHSRLCCACFEADARGAEGEGTV